MRMTYKNIKIIENTYISMLLLLFCISIVCQKTYIQFQFVFE